MVLTAETAVGLNVTAVVPWYHGLHSALQAPGVVQPATEKEVEHDVSEAEHVQMERFCR
jgi:hypothetical protein